MNTTPTSAYAAVPSHSSTPHLSATMSVATALDFSPSSPSVPHPASSASGAYHRHTLVHLALVGVFMAGVLAHSHDAQAQAQTVMNGAGGAGRYVPVIPNVQPASKPVAVLDGAYAANAKVGRINVTVRNAGVPADGQSMLDLDIEVFDLNDAPMDAPVLVTVEHNGGKLQLQGAATDEFGPGRKDADRLVPGTQIKVNNGKASIGLIAPSQAQDVTVRLTAGAAEVTGIVPFNPDVRELVAAGLVEGSLRLSKKSYASTLSPVRVDDGFEQEIRRFSHTSSSASGLNTTDKAIAGRGALFLKGKIAGDALLTLSFDSDKETRARLLRDIKPDDFYPVYGDASIKGFEAKSSDRLYVRVDQNRSFIMYGDFNTGSGFSQSAGTGVVAGSNMRQLATYNRSMTGIKAHAENETGFVNAFISRDSLKSVTEELRANGTSGPFAIGNASALENSERIELITRDRNNLSIVLAVTQLERLNDYVFEPFSARILLSRAIPSFDANGNPLSLRISYEVEQGGKNFIVAGVDGQLNLGKNLVVGGALFEDKNPLAPVRIAGVNAGYKFGDADAPPSNSKTTLIGELAHSKTGVNSVTGNAARLELAHQDDELQAKVYANRTDADFKNQSTGTINGTGAQPGAGNQQLGASITYKATDKLSVNAAAQQSTTLNTDAKALTATLGAGYAVNDTITVKAGVRHSQEQGVLANTVSGLGCNPAAGSAYAPGNTGGIGNSATGNTGFNGAGSSTLLNVNCARLPTTTATTATDRSSTTLALGVDAKVNDKLTLSASVEGGKASSNGSKFDQASRLELGISYQIAERTRLYARADSQRGLASQYSLEPAAKSQTLSLGIDSSYMQGGNVFSEYRLRDSVGGQESQIASGLRNAWQLSEGMLLSTSAERLKLLSGTGQNATALTAGLDYTAGELWKAGGRVEWRRLDAVNSPATSNSTPSTNPITQQDTLLFTVNASRKLAQDWTVLARNYYLATNNHGAAANGWQDRFQIGAAYRPVDNNALDVLSKFEYKTETNINGQNEARKVLVGAVQANYHPSRAWWMSARLAAKYVNERLPANEGGGADKYKAYLIGGRVIYDLTENVDLGMNLGLMSGKGTNQTGASVQKGLGFEVGYRMATNLWATLGYNVAGYSDKDLTSDYTSKGVYLKLRYKFDQDLFESNNPKVNNLLAPPTDTGAAK